MGTLRKKGVFASIFNKKNLVGYAFLLPMLIVFSFSVFYPIIRGVWLSFFEFRVKGNLFVGLDNFVSVLADKNVYNAFKNTVMYALMTVPTGLFIALVLASILYTLPMRLQSFFKGAYYLPGVLSGAVVAITWKWILDPDLGILNALLQNIGLEGSKWLTHPSTALPSLAMISLLSGQGKSIVVLLANMGSISDEVYDSAKIDGAGPVNIFFRITIPLLKPTILYILVTELINSFTVFETIYMMTGGGPARSTTTIAYLIYQEGFSFFNHGRASAMATLLFFVIALITVVQFKLLEEKE